MRISNTTREKHQVMCKRIPIRPTADFSSRNPAGQVRMRSYIQSADRKKLPAENTIPRKPIL
jgi:hypothetical protein